MKCEIYQEIDKIIRDFSLSKEEIDQIYLDEGIIDKSLEQQIADIKRELDELRREYLTYQAQGKIDKVDKERYQELENKLIDKCDKLQERLAHPEEKILSVGIGTRIKSRNYPSDELRNKVFYGTIRLAQFYARRYQYMTKGKFGYDDLFQIASEALLAACHYYVPNGKANFFTYASACIRNRLNRELFPKKKRRTKSFLEQEKYNISYIEMFLNLQFRGIGKVNPPDRQTPVAFMSSFKNLISQHNSEMLNTNQPAKVFSVGNRKREESERYELLIDRISKMLSTSKLQLLISDDDRRMVSELADYKNVLSREIDAWTLLEYFKKYVRRLEDIETYLSIFEEIREDVVDGKLFYNEVLKKFNQRVHEFNSNVYRLRHTNAILLEPRVTYFSEYFDQYNVNFLYNECFEVGISSEEEKEQIREEKDEKLMNLMYEDHLDEEFGYDDFDLTDEYEELLNQMVKEELASRKNHVLEIVKQKNEVIFAANKKKLEDKKYFGRHYRRKYKMQDILEIEKDISLLYSDNEAIFDAPQARRRRSLLSVLEQVEVELFLADYQRALEQLPSVQKDILNLWFDEAGIHSMSAKEISSTLGIPPRQVYREKEKAIKSLQKSKVLKSYCE